MISKPTEITSTGFVCAGLSGDIFLLEAVRSQVEKQNRSANKTRTYLYISHPISYPCYLQDRCQAPNSRCTWSGLRVDYINSFWLGDGDSDGISQFKTSFRQAREQNLALDQNAGQKQHWEGGKPSPYSYFYELFGSWSIYN